MQGFEPTVMSHLPLSLDHGFLPKNFGILVLVNHLFIHTSIATSTSCDCRPSAFLEAHDEVVNISLANEDQEDVDALKHVDDVSHIPEVDLS